MAYPSNQDADTSSSVLTRARNQDPAGWMRLVEWIGPFILVWCRRGGLQAADQDEVSQEVLSRIWRGLKNFRKDNPADSFRAWVYTITRNCIHDLVAKRKDAPGPLPAGLPPRSDSAEGSDLRQHAIQLVVQDVIARYGEEPGFQAFYRVAVDGRSAVEAARELNLSPDSVRQHKSRWIRKLRDLLAVEFGDLLG